MAQDRQHGAWVWRAAVLAAAALLLGGCLAGFHLPFHSKVKVEREHAPGLGVPGASFVILPAATTEPGPLFDEQAARVSRSLQQRGFREAARGGVADLTVVLATRAEPFTYTWNKPIYVEVGGGTQRVSATRRGPDGIERFEATIDVPRESRYIGTQRVTDIAFWRRLAVTIRRGDAKLFYGSAMSYGDTPAEAAGAECLVAALFRDFPGRSGETRVFFYPWGRCPPV